MRCDNVLAHRRKWRNNRRSLTISSRQLAGLANDQVVVVDDPRNALAKVQTQRCLNQAQ
jgi:hypothetical protein